MTKQAGQASYVVLLLHRPAYEPPKEAAHIELADLASDAVGELLEAHLGVVPQQVARLVGERAGGNPFYVEEIVRHLLEAGILGMSDEGYQLVRNLRPEDLPGSIESLIAARLDRLSSDAKVVAQHGAVIGRSFLFQIPVRLRQVEGAAKVGVGELAARELIFEKAPQPLEYIWKHALTRDVAYASILAGRRRAIHAAVADAIEQLFVGEREAFLAMVGHHREQAGQRDEARAAYLTGGRAAVKRYAHEEAERLYRDYLRLVDVPTGESIRARNELGRDVYQLRGRMREAEAEHKQAIDEARAIGHRLSEGASLREIGIVYKNTGRMTEARAYYDEALAIAREEGDRQVAAAWLGNLALLLHEQGRMEDARSHYEQALAIQREVGDRSLEATALGNLAGFIKRRGG